MTKEIQKLPGKARMPVRIKVLELNGEYTGWQVKARVNPTVRTIGQIATGDVEAIIPALKSLLLDWNFVDEDGAELGEPSEENIANLPMDLLNAIATQIVEEITNIPKP